MIGHELKKKQCLNCGRSYEEPYRIKDKRGICLAHLKSCKESNWDNLPKSEEGRGRHGIPPQA